MMDRMTSELFANCTARCAAPVPCPDCGQPLPPRGRSVAPEFNLPSCCGDHQHTDLNTRHIWSADELPEPT
jgi:hypothetical protein